ncbi:MAG: glycosyltransferase [Thermodesulfobacteriota bacterium]
MNKPFVSVIIPVLNDSERLQTCLKALENQTYLKSMYEVIVVDNGSDENIEGLVSQYIQAKLSYESCPGSYAARNKGLSIAKGYIIAFTDSDCIPAPDWIEKGIANLLRVPNCGLVAGKVNIFFKNPDKPTAVELFESVIAFQQKRYAEVRGFGATANVFTFRSVIDHVGNFNEKLKSGGDVEWGQRVFSYGYKLTYTDDACVAHSARYSLKELYNKHIRILGGEYDLIKSTSSYPFIILIKNLFIEFLPPVISLARIYSSEKFKRLNGTLQKCKVILVFLFIRYARIWERIRLLLVVRSIG